MIDYLYDFHEKDPKGLFEIIRQSDSFSLAHFIISVLRRWKNVFLNKNLWLGNKQFYYKTDFQYFQGSKWLMEEIIEKENWPCSRESLSIQKQYLFKLKMDESQSKSVKK